MRRIVLLVLLASSGCFWNQIPGTIAYDRRIAREDAAARDSIAALDRVASDEKERFYECMARYANTQVRAAATATEIAQAASAACSDPFGKFTATVRRSMDLIIETSRSTPAGQHQLQLEANNHVSEIMDRVATEGRQRAVRVIVERRATPP